MNRQNLSPHLPGISPLGYIGNLYGSARNGVSRYTSQRSE